jgi:Tfp pilus assembly protein PilX
MHSDRQRGNLEGQRGNALLFVTVVGLVITLGFAMFMTSTVVVEERAVEAELAKSRAYWAEMGNFNYAESRISYSKLCNGCGKSKDTDLAIVMQAYFDELQNNKVWTYPDESPNYSITTTTTAATAGGQTYSGWLTATSTYTSSALVASSSGTLPQMKLGICVGLPGQGDRCGWFFNNNGGNTSAYFSINNLANLPKP